MKTYRNTRPSHLIIPDASIVLAPGETVMPEKLSFQTEQAIAKGYLAEVTDSTDEPTEENTAPAASKSDKRKASGKKDDSPDDMKKQLEELSGGAG